LRVKRGDVGQRLASCMGNSAAGGAWGTVWCNVFTVVFVTAALPEQAVVEVRGEGRRLWAKQGHGGGRRGRVLLTVCSGKYAGAGQ
jgi:hypothetical protein